MGLHALITAVACAGQLGLLVLVIARNPRSPLTLPFAAMTGALFAWNFASLSYELSGLEPWADLDFALSPQVGPAALFFVLTYLGRRRQLRAVLFAAWGLFSILTAAAALWLAGLPSLSLGHWSTIQGVLVASSFSLGMVLLLKHLGEAVLEAEKLRTRIMILGFTVLPVLGVSDLANAALGNVPRLASLGTLITSALFARIALGLDLLGQRRSPATLAYAALLGSLGVLGYVSLWALSPQGGVAAFVLATGTLVLLVGVRQVTRAFSERRARTEQFTTLGRVSAQMAHDLKNPLAALKGAAQFLQEERARGKDFEDSGPVLDLMVEQIDRIHRVIDAYQRVARVQAARSEVQLNELVQKVCGLQSLAPPAGISMRQALAQNLPRCAIDPDLVASALENLVRNGLQAMPKGGTLTVRTDRGEQDGTVVLSVEDTGVGMDPRTKERAFDPFFTTKADGSGMGLAFVRRVVEAHHGSVSLSSREGQGTQIRLLFPIEAEPEDAAA